MRKQILINLICPVKGLALFWPFSIECLAFFSNFVGRFWPFFTEGFVFFEKINLAGLAVGCANKFIFLMLGGSFERKAVVKIGRQ